MKRILCEYKPNLNKQFPWVLRHPKLKNALAIFKTRKDALNWFLSLRYESWAQFHTPKKIWGGHVYGVFNKDQVLEYELEVEKYDGKLAYDDIAKEIHLTKSNTINLFEVENHLATLTPDIDFKVLEDQITYFPETDDFVPPVRKNSKDVKIEELTKELNSLDELLKNLDGKSSKEIEELKNKLQDSNHDKEALLREIQELKNRSLETKTVVEQKVHEVVREVPVYIEKEVLREIPVEIIKEVLIDRPVEVIKEVQVEKPVEIIKEVEVIKEVIVEKPVASGEVFREVPVYIEKEVLREIPVEVFREIEVERPVEVIKEVIVEKPGATQITCSKNDCDKVKFVYFYEGCKTTKLRSLALYAKKLERVAVSFDREVVTSERDFREIETELRNVLNAQKSLTNELYEPEDKKLLKLVAKSLAWSTQKLAKKVKGSKDVEYGAESFVYYKEKAENARLARVVSFVLYGNKHVAFVPEADYKYALAQSSCKKSHFVVFESFETIEKLVPSVQVQEVIKEVVIEKPVEVVKEVEIVKEVIVEKPIEVFKEVTKEVIVEKPVEAAPTKDNWPAGFWALILYALGYVILLAVVIVLAIWYYNGF